MLDAKVRSPTGLAWVVSVALFFVAGEILFEMRKEAPASILSTPFSDGELLVAMIISGAGAAVAIAWLISLYVAPGRLILDLQAGLMRREERRRIRRVVTEAPLAAWTVRIVYFSSAHRVDGVFKRLELGAPGLREVLLFSDFGGGERVGETLEAAAEQLGSFEVRVEKADPEALEDQGEVASQGDTPDQ